MLKSKLFQVSAKAHALMNNEALTFSLFKLNLGFWLIIDAQILPTPRVWLRVPFIGELIAGFTQYEVCSDSFIPDFIRFEVLGCDWKEVSRSTYKLWEDIQDPEMLSVSGSPNSTTLENLIEWGLRNEQAIRLCEEAGEAPYFMIRGISQRIDSVRY